MDSASVTFMMILIGMGALVAAIVIFMHPQANNEPKHTTSGLEGNPLILKLPIAGINFREGITHYVGRFNGTLVPEPTNEYDPNAIAIHHSDGHLLGYVPATSTISLHSLLAGRFPYDCVGEIQDAGDHFIGFIYLLKPTP